MLHDLTSQKMDVNSTLGSEANAWYFSGRKDGERIFDLTRSKDENAAGLSINVSTGARIKIGPSTSALVVIDMQNYFLSEALGRSRGAGHLACDKLIKHAIPAAREAGIQVIWLNWGLTEEDLWTMPPAVERCFGFPARTAEGHTVLLDRHGTVREDRPYAGFGAEIGRVAIPEHELLDSCEREVDAGRLLFSGMWNADIYGPLRALRNSEDALISKTRISGLWGGETPLQIYLEKEGITTLLFAGVNTDQCVGTTLTDAFCLGYDCILLKDGCGTSSPAFGQQAWEYNVENTFGFVTTCENMQNAEMG